ncbi:P-loop containing nucleoside triphosphate hydrolase protein [Clavulina sp. PMI_390]|nr:P-loop containing nucleoside triphosphate hydrolase protein [Clavulina sp. PMI_390]
MLDDLAREAADRLNSTTPAASAPKKSAEKENLWVDRYRPQRFVDLTGDERVNRETLSWVKEWDQCVFNRAKPKLKRKRDEPVAPAQQDVKVDQWGRPQEKILLISGPPGLGKTTLAHIVAKQAGYDVLEINASDARSGSVIEDRIRPALESGKAVMGNNQKPVLVVIDEVDGATGEGSANHAGFINKLVGLTIDPPRRRNPNGTKNARRPLLRPIICVCNDLYAPSLAKLRLCAKIVRIHPSSTHVLTKRLKDICDEESLRTESRALTTLAEVCQGDIRSCLNALQFMKMKGPASGVTQELVRTATVGVKEGDTSVQSVWADLFTPMTKKRARAAGLTDVEEARYVSRLARSVETSGGVDRVALGAFEHYTTLHPHETTLKRFEAANDWLSTYDSFASAAWHDQEYALQAYLPYTIVPLFHHMASNSNAKVERPTAYWDVIFAALTKAILYPDGNTQHQTMLSESAGYRYMLGKEVLRTEFVPILNRVISPPMRPVNKQIIKAEERGVLNRLVEIMVSTGLQYEQDKTEDGQLLYRLTPAIDSFIVYDGKRANDVGSARYAVRHMIASEVDEVLSKRQSRVVEKSVGTNGMGRMGMGARKDKGKEDDHIDIADKPAVDFFGRPIVLPQPKASTVTPSDREKLVGLDLLPKKVAIPFAINYRYHEGNSSAVRKPTKVSTFL